MDIQVDTWFQDLLEEKAWELLQGKAESMHKDKKVHISDFEKPGRYSLEFSARTQVSGNGYMVEDTGERTSVTLAEVLKVFLRE